MRNLNVKEMKGSLVTHKRFPELGIGTVIKSHSKTMYVQYKTGAILRCNKSELTVVKKEEEKKCKTNAQHAEVM